MELVKIAAEIKKLINVPVDVVLDTEITAQRQNQQRSDQDMIADRKSLTARKLRVA